MPSPEGDAAKRPLSANNSPTSVTAEGPGKRPRAGSPTPRTSTSAEDQHSSAKAASTEVNFRSADTGYGRRGRGRRGGGHGGRGNQQTALGRDSNHSYDTTTPPPANDSIALFTTLGAALDDMHDRRERIVKISRDITIGSKRAISLLHRVAGLAVVGANESITSTTTATARADILTQARTKIADVVALFHVVASDLQGNDFHKHHRSIAPGIEEFIEAVSFQRYIEHGDLISRDDLQREFFAVGPQHDGRFTVTDEDYVLGLADLTGELMRLAINSVAKGDTRQIDDICRFLRDLANDYEEVNFPPARKKMDTMRASLAKVEKACYALKVRGAEYPPEVVAEMLATGLGPGDDPRDEDEIRH
ncbi:hypothetical protein HDU86_006511 [Geranomyces michiganensis]|nr:hypothetical protein HDU86_006511 [Geranomyces michiganensis]